MISIGAQFGGPELANAPIRNMILRATQIAKKVRTPNYDDGSEAWINPIFIVPGSMWKPQFERYEFGHFSRKKKGMVIRIAVPQSVADGVGIAEFIGSSLRDAVRLTAERFAAKRISFSAIIAMKLVEEIEREFGDGSNTLNPSGPS